MQELKIHIYPDNSIKTDTKSYYDNEEYKIASLEEYKKIHRAISPIRLQILMVLKEKEQLTISELSRILGRDYKNVYEDIQILLQFKFITSERKGNKLILSVPFNKLNIFLHFSS
ncbi:HVO_A0114 family putative DNA-binding protein [Desulfurobacterium sp.]